MRGRGETLYPADLGFFMPAEWREHARTFMAWPVREALWPEPFAEVLTAFAAIVKAINRFEPVTVIARPELLAEARSFCGPAAAVLAMEHNDSWLRDNGPTFLLNSQGEVAGINWIFNAWGGKFPWEKDNLVAPALMEHLGIPYFEAPVVMEGGSIHVDGEGTLLTTEECLLNNNRNPHLTREELEEILKRFLNVRKIIWLKRGLVGDDTDGHVDNIACFAGPGVILTQVCSSPEDPNYEVTKENLAVLEKATDAKGRSLTVIRIEQPPAVYHEGVRQVLSYLNFYFVNGGIIMPVFGGDCAETDRAAQETLKRVFPDREIVAVDGLPIARGGGNVHCLTQQLPAGTPARNLL